uniref:Glucuronosyltransferase n=1 Tax=Meloidogyne hapla TaxID=6305 RepID=A0A1I8BYN2_MELHA
MNNKCESSNQIKMFKWLRNKRKEEEPSTQEQQPTIRSLYSKIKAIFINNDELFDFPLGDSKPDNLYYVGGFHFENEYFKQMAALFGRKILYMPNDITKIIIEKRSKVSVERTIVLISLDNCEKIFDNCSFARNEKLWEVFLNAFVQILQIENNLNFIYDCSLDKIDKVKLEDTLNKYDNYNLNININKIQNINEEMAKGTTRMLITNCSGYQVIEAIAYNVEIYCIPRYPDQFYVAEALKLQYFKTRVNIEERPYTQEVFNSIKNIPLSLDRTDVVIYRMILSPVEYIREMFNRKWVIILILVSIKFLYK